jgi:Aminoglycoside-2''-adenylyltransferase
MPRRTVHTSRGSSLVALRRQTCAVADERDYGFLWAWEPVRPAELRGLLAGLTAPWWVAGGWALDLFLGRETRTHEDLDVAVLRRDQLALHRHLHGWDLRYATPEHTLEPWDASYLALPVHGIWARRSARATAPWTCEFLLNEERDGYWVYRHNETVKRPIDEIGAMRDGVPFLRPEIVLLYKSTDDSPKNAADFDVVLPNLEADARRWLAEALAVCDSHHGWLARLRICGKWRT